MTMFDAAGLGHFHGIPIYTVADNDPRVAGVKPFHVAVRGNACYVRESEWSTVRVALIAHFTIENARTGAGLPK